MLEMPRNVEDKTTNSAERFFHEELDSGIEGTWFFVLPVDSSWADMFKIPFESMSKVTST